MHILVNAIPIRPGGGLTVLLGILKGLRQSSLDDLRLTVLCSASDTAAILREQATADEVHVVCRDKGVIARQAWQNFRLGAFANQIGADGLVTINFLVPRVKCPQVVYHLDLARYVPIPDEVSGLERIAERLRNRAALQALRMADANVFESQFLRDAASQFVTDDPKRNQVIYIGLPDEVIDEALEHSNLSEPSARIVAVTNPLPHKDNPTMIRAFAAIVGQCPAVAWSLEIAGGLNRQAWQPHRDLARELGVEDRIVWHGYLDHSELDQLLRSCLCQLSTSILESFCMVAVESMARGCPPVVSDVASMPESVGNAGMLVAPGDYSGFADAVLRIHQDSAWRTELISRGFSHIESLRWSRCGDQFAELLRSLQNRQSVTSKRPNCQKLHL